jgi:hypothetical protein
MAEESADGQAAELARSWAQLARVNLAGSHADLVETIITLEEQLSLFATSMDLITADCSRLWEGCHLVSLQQKLKLAVDLDVRFFCL